MNRGKLAYVVLLIACVDLIYAIPYVANWYVLGSSSLPPFQSDDIYFYLIVAAVPHTGTIVNPWFGNAIEANEVQHLQFSFGLRAFGMMERLNPWGATFSLFFWNMFWTTAIVVAALWLSWCLELEPFSAPGLTVFGIIVFFRGAVLAQGLYRWIRTRSFALGFIQLPYYRSFYPQIAIPFLLAFVGVLFKAFQQKRRQWWALLAVIQILGMLAFPYTALLMIGMLATAIVLQALRRQPFDWLGATLCLATSIAADFVFVLIAGGGGSKQPMPLGLDFMLPEHVAFVTSFAILLLTAVTFFLERSSGGRLLGATSLGIAFALAIWFGDVFIPRALRVSFHIGYFDDIVFAILVARILAILNRTQTRRWLRPACAVVAMMLFLYGASASWIAAKSNLPISLAQRELVAVLNKMNAGAGDLIVANANSTVQEGQWLPLVTRAQVLFNSYAQPFVPRAHEEIYWFRFAALAHTLGNNSDELARRYANPELAAALIGPRDWDLASGRHRRDIIESSKQSFLDQLTRVESAGTYCRVLRSYRRVFIVEQATEMPFSRPQLAPCLVLRPAETAGPWTVTSN